MTKLFITGATGYLGGHILHHITAQYPSLQITALLRAENTKFSTTYTDIKVLIGTFDSFDIISTATSEADIIVHAGDIDHAGCVAAILSGLRVRSSKHQKTYLLHLTGTGCISDELTNTWQGNFNTRVWNDIDDIVDIYNLDEKALHHALDVEIMDANDEWIKTACIVPSDVYGPSKAVGNHKTFMIPLYVDACLKAKETFYLGKGENVKAVVHVDDVASLFTLLLSEALKGGERVQWGREGFYFAVSGEEVQWKVVAQRTNDLLAEKGALKADSSPKSWDRAKIAGVVPNWERLPLYLWGSNTRAEAARAKSIGWKPAGLAFWDYFEEDVLTVVKAVEAKKASKMKM